MFKKFFVFLCVSITLVTPVYAWDGVVSGQIHAVDVTSAENFGFRVYLKNVSTHCSGGLLGRT